VKDVETPSKSAAAADDGAADPTDAWSLLTDAEWRLVLLASSGWNDRRIASAIGKTQGQVKDQFQALLDRLGLADRLTLILASFANGARLQSHDGERLRDSNNGAKVYAQRNS
jgi:DNA-binding NarL/FixJ family response regulator